MPCRGSRSRPVLMSAMTSCQDGVRSTYPRSTDIRICLQRPFHPEAIIRTFGRHAVTGTAVVGSESTTWSVAAGFKQPVRSAAIGFWCTNKLPELRPLYHCVFGGSTRGTCVLGSGGWSRKGPEVVWLRRQQAPTALLWANGEICCNSLRKIQSALPQPRHTQCELANRQKRDGAQTFNAKLVGTRGLGIIISLVRGVGLAWPGFHWSTCQVIKRTKRGGKLGSHCDCGYRRRKAQRLRLKCHPKGARKIAWGRRFVHPDSSGF